MAKSASGRLLALSLFAAALGASAITACVASTDLDETSDGLALSQYKYSSKSQTGNLITFYGPYLLNNNGTIFKIYQSDPYTLAAQKWCDDQGYTLSSYRTVTYSGVRVAIATSLAAEWWFYGWKTNATVLNQVVCRVAPPPTPDAGVDAPPPTPDAATPAPDAPDPCNGCWDY